MSEIHLELAAGRWRTLSLLEQLGHIGSEVSRALRAQESGNPARMMKALERGLELFDLTPEDPRHLRRLREICRAREVVCDYFVGENVYGSSGSSLERYFNAFALAAKRR